MEKSKHTPKPWGFGNTDEGKRLILGDNGKGEYVCSVQIYQTPRKFGLWEEDKRLANANLISAAPDLLEACKIALDIHNREHPKCTTCLGYIRLTQAIAKVEDIPQ